MMAAHIPAHIRPGIARYIVLGIPPGRFLLAAFANDLFEAARAADAINAAALANVANWIEAHAPDDCRGSAEAVSAWTKRGGLRGPVEGAT